MKIHHLANLGCKNNSENFPNNWENFTADNCKTEHLTLDSRRIKDNLCLKILKTAQDFGEWMVTN